MDIRVVTIWALALGTVLVAASGCQAGLIQSTDRTAQFSEIIQDKMNFRLTVVVNALEENPTDGRFGINRVPIETLGDHHRVQIFGPGTLWLVGNGTAKFDPASWRAQTVPSGRRLFHVPTDEERERIISFAKEATSEFQDGREAPVRWQNWKWLLRSSPRPDQKGGVPHLP